MRLLTAGFVMLAGVALADPPQNMTGKRELKMQHCPSSVRGATTQLLERKDGVELTVTSAKPAAREEIRKRARHQERIAMQPARGAIEHTGEGTGSGGLGYCPGMLAETRVTAEDVPGGAKLLIHADSPDRVRELQRTTRERIDALPSRR